MAVAGDGLSPTIPKSLTAAFVPCFRTPVPGAGPRPPPVLPVAVLPGLVMSRHRVVSPLADPDSTLMAGVSVSRGAPTVLFLMIMFAELLELVTPAKMPCPALLLMTLLVIEALMLPACPTP